MQRTMILDLTVEVPIEDLDAIAAIKDGKDLFNAIREDVDGIAIAVTRKITDLDEVQAAEICGERFHITETPEEREFLKEREAQRQGRAEAFAEELERRLKADGVPGRAIWSLEESIDALDKVVCEGMAFLEKRTGTWGDGPKVARKLPDSPTQYEVYREVCRIFDEHDPGDHLFLECIETEYVFTENATRITTFEGS